MKTIMHNPLPQFRLVITIGSRKIHYTQSADNLEQAKQYAAQCFDVSPDRVEPDGLNDPRMIRRTILA